MWDTFLEAELDSFLSLPEHPDEWAMEEVLQGEQIPRPCTMEETSQQNAELADMFAAEQAPCQV